MYHHITPNLFIRFSFSSAPTSYPTNISVVSLSLDSITFKWNVLECDQQSAPITAYECKLFTEEGNFTETVTENQASFDIYVSMILHTGSKLSFSVAAINPYGVGKHCPLVEVCTPREG